MTLKKRGLGRGLEVLLADTPSLEGLQQQTPVNVELTNAQAIAGQTLLENLQREKLSLLQEAQALKSLLDEVESIIRAGLD